VAAKRLWWQRSNGGAQRWGAAMAEKVAAQRWQWRRSDGLGGAATAMMMAVQRWGWQWWRRRAAVAVVNHPPLFACGCSSAASSPQTPSSLCH
jgi:hypothetical protein